MKDGHYATGGRWLSSVRYGCANIVMHGLAQKLYVCGCVETWCPFGTGALVHEYVPHFDEDGNAASGNPSGKCFSAKQLFGIHHFVLGGWVKDKHGNAKFTNTKGVHLWEALAF